MTSLFNFQFSHLFFICRIQPNIRAPVYCTAVREGTRQDFDFLWTKFLNTNVAHEEVTILNALGCAKSSETLFVSTISLSGKIENKTNFVFTDTFG